MSDQSLRDALETIKAELQKRSDEGEAHLFLNIPYRQLEELLAEYPGEAVRPLPTREQIAEALEVQHIRVGRKAYVTPACACGWFGENFEAHLADAVLALMGGAEQQTSGGTAPPGKGRNPK